MKSLRSKLIVTMLGIAITITAVLGVIALTSIKSTTKKTLKTTYIPLAEQAADIVDSTILNQQESVSAIISSDAFGDGTTDEQMNYIEEGITDKYRTDYAIFNSSGTLLKASGDIIKNIDVKETVTKASTDKTSTNTDVIENDGFIGYCVAVPVVENDKVSLVVVVAYKINAFSDKGNKINYGETGEYILVTDSGLQLLTDGGGKVTKRDAVKLAKSEKDYKSEAEFIKHMLKFGKGDGEYEADGIDRIAGYAKSNSINLKVVISSEKDEYLSSSVTGTYKLFIAMGILLVAVVVASIFFARTISKPIVSTTTRLRALSQGNLSDPVDVCYSKDELGVLSNSLEETVVSLRQYINLITVALTNISEGNLCHRVDGTFKGDFIKIKSTFNAILESLSDTFASINIAAEQVSSGAVQVSNNAQSLSQGSTQQASSIEELSATITDVSNQTTQNADSAKEAYMIVQSNADAIAECNKDMEKMLAAMGEISESSAEISKIIKVIDEISFQTNILALNAAVEAAREGSKGFGVVADEVRRLASKSAEAAKQTAALIENSADAISRGSEIAQQTAGSLNKIVEDSTEIKKLVKDISDASEHQSEAIVQINTGVDQISAVVASNTSTAVGSASASEELSSQSLILKNMIARFKLSKSSKASAGMYDYVSDEGGSAKSANSFAYPDEPDVAPSPVSKFAYPDEPDDAPSPVSKFAYPDEPDDAPSPVSKFAYPDEPDDEPSPLSKFAYPDDEEEVKIILDDDEEFNPESINDEDDKY